jgi:hypothetical protein
MSGGPANVGQFGAGCTAQAPVEQVAAPMRAGRAGRIRAALDKAAAGDRSDSSNGAIVSGHAGFAAAGTSAPTAP